MMKKLLSALLLGMLLLSTEPVFAQRHCVVIDADTEMPVSHASLFTKENGKFHSAITDARGRATISFSFRRLTVSHLNYERLTLRSLKDTIRLKPISHLAAEVVVSSEPAWIRPLLRRFIKQRQQYYGNQQLTLSYLYKTQSIEGHKYYNFQSEGMLKTPWSEEKDYQFAQSNALITSVDSTKLTDMVNLRRMLYEDFVSDFNNSFIRSHRFSVSERDDDLTDDEVELIFRSKKDKDDHGRFVIDTARCIIREAVRTTGLKTNRQLRVNATMLALARMMSGYNITAWDVDYSVKYVETLGCWHPADIRYKFFFTATEQTESKDEAEFHNQTGGGFTNMESTVSLRPAEQQPDSTSFTTLPRTWYIKINSDDDRAIEIELANLPAQFVLYQEEE